jgi:hypothetical protein
VGGSNHTGSGFGGLGDLKHFRRLADNIRMNSYDRVFGSNHRASRARFAVTLTALLLSLSSCAGSESDNSATNAPATRAQGVSKIVEESAEEQSSTTAANSTATTSPVTIEAAPQANSRDNPITAGETVAIGDWQVTVLAANPDATESVLEENPYNEAPTRGRQLFTVEVAATYVGDESDAVFSGLTFTALGDSSVAYDYDAQCGVIPNPLVDFTEVFPGGTVRGNLCWSILSTDAENLLLIADPVFGFSSERAFMEIPSPDASFPAPDPAAAQIEAGEPGSRGNPVPVGATVTMGDWEVVVTGSVTDATAEVLASNSFNEPPAPDHQFLTVELRTTYVGGESDSVFSGLTFTSVARSSVAYDYETSCGVIPDELDDFAEVFTGGVVSGSLCWSVLGSDVDSLVLIVDPGFSFADERVFMAVR